MIVEIYIEYFSIQIQFFVISGVFGIISVKWEEVGTRRPPVTTVYGRSSWIIHCSADEVFQELTSLWAF